MCLLLTAVSRTVTQLYTYDTVTCMCFKLVKNSDMSCGNLVHSNPSTNQVTEKKHSKRKAPYRPLERTEEHLKEKQGEDRSTICKKKYLKEKGAQPSINENKNHYELQKRSWVEGLRECHMKSQSKKPPPRRTGQKRPKKQPEKAAHRGERCPWKRTTMKMNFAKNLKSQRKSHKRKDM